MGNVCDPFDTLPPAQAHTISSHGAQYDANTNLPTVTDTRSGTDSLPHWPDHNNRTLQDPALLRAQAKGKRHRRLLWRPRSHPAAVAPHRLLRRAVRHHGPVRRLPGHHRRFRAKRPGRGSIHWRLHRPHGAGCQEECRVAGLMPEGGPLRAEEEGFAVPGGRDERSEGKSRSSSACWLAAALYSTMLV